MTTTAAEISGKVLLKAAFDTSLHKQVRNLFLNASIRVAHHLAQCKYGTHLPVYEEITTFPPLQLFEFNDRGLVGNKEKVNLLPENDKTIKASPITPVIGTGIRGLQISQLNDVQKDELALLIAERGVLPGITILTLLEVPVIGGDTVWASQTAAYSRLSTPIKTPLAGLRAENIGHPQADNARRDGKHVRRQPVKSEHPIATGQKALFVQLGFTKRIIGLKQEESDSLLKLLFKHSAQGQDFQARVRWEEGIALWDNRATTHTAINDYNVHNPQEGLRHRFRITTLADRPTGVNDLESE
ncbi:Fc.00g105820.m01.CDS01 [Cosmosporella sp. VM-42]